MRRTLSSALIYLRKQLLVFEDFLREGKNTGMGEERKRGENLRVGQKDVGEMKG